MTNTRRFLLAMSCPVLGVGVAGCPALTAPQTGASIAVPPAPASASAPKIAPLETVTTPPGTFFTAPVP